MEIYLVRHGAAYDKEDDPERHLNSDGVSQCHLTGRAVKRLDIQFDLIVSSPIARARQTAEIIAEETGYSRAEIKITEKLEPTVLPNETLSYLNDFADVKRILLVGHLPLLGYLASELLINTSQIQFYFEPASVCKINTEQPRAFEGDFCWFLAQEHIRIIGQVPNT